MNTRPHITAQVAPFVKVLGEDLAAEFFLQFGGTVVLLNPNPRPETPYVKLIGLDNARALSEATMRSAKRLPIPKRFLAVVLRNQGKKVVEIARTLHCADESVRRWLLDAPLTSSQPSSHPDQLPLI